MIGVIAYLVYIGLDRRTGMTSRPPIVTNPEEPSPAPLPIEGGKPSAVAQATDGTRSLIAYETPEDELRLALYDGDRLVSRPNDVVLSTDTNVSGLRLGTMDGRDVALFNARDDKWETAYVWETTANRVHFRARRLGESRARFSDNIPAGTDIARHLGYSASSTPSPPVASPAPSPPPPSGPPVLRVDSNGGAKRIVLAQDGRVVSRLGQTFDAQTTVWGLTTTTVGGRTMAVFSAQDPRFRTRYAWDYDRGRFYWLTQNRSSGSQSWSGRGGSGSAPPSGVRSYLAATL